MNPYHKANQHRWQQAAKKWGEMHDRRGAWKLAPTQPDLALAPEEQARLGEVSGKKVCVLGSGDNLVVFALAGKGAEVTSIDLSEAQLDIAARRAEALDLNITFQCADVSDLNMIDDRSFDMVYTGGHVAVWVSDLETYYSEAVRILRPGGRFLINEFHPFRRIWKDSTDTLSVRAGYFNRGPHYFEVPEGLFDENEGDIPSYEFNWTVADYLTAVLKTGAEILAVEEYGDAPEGFETAPTKGLPNFLLIEARKR